jgi:hypothetical protein
VLAAICHLLTAFSFISRRLFQKGAYIKVLDGLQAVRWHNNTCPHAG